MESPITISFPVDLSSTQGDFDALVKKVEAESESPPRVERRGTVADVYFKAGEIRLPEGMHLFLDDDDVTNVASEANLAEGWAMIYPHERMPNGEIEYLPQFPGGGIAAEKRNGKVELRPHPAVV